MNELDIFTAALELGATEKQEKYLDEACKDNEPLRERIEALLRSADKVSRFMESPAHGVGMRVSVDPGGAQANGASTVTNLSPDGRYVAFSSSASNLVPGDTNGVTDVFVYDRESHLTERASVDANGAQGDGLSSNASITADGRYVSFASWASNLVPGDTNGKADLFVYDRQTHVIERVSVAADGTQGDGGPLSSSISGDGRYVAFHSGASNLVPGDTGGRLRGGLAP